MTTNKQQKNKKEFVFWIVFISIIAIYLFLHFFYSVGFLLVQGDSMQPHYHNNQVCMIANFNYSPQQGDVVCFKNDKLNKKIIKRVIATEGQVVKIDYKNNEVYVDGESINSDFAKEPMVNYPKLFTTSNPYTVPKGTVFVLGDNRNNSMDSRYSDIGAVAVEDIIGKVYGIEHG